MGNVAGGSSGTFHMIGLVSDGNVHANIGHVYAMIDGAIEEVRRVPAPPAHPPAANTPAVR